MSHIATAVHIMIASPSDVADAREAVYRAVARWNEAHTSKRNVELIPIRWETSAVPLLGCHPQAIINEQLLERADIVIALFGSRLGTVTPDAVSGTAEEIGRAEDAGKPVHLYFSNAPHPNDVEPAQLQALREFRSAVEARGLVGSFGSSEELTALVWQAIEHDLGVLKLTAPTHEPTKASGVRFFAQPGEERLAKTDSKGRLRYDTRRWVELTNQGDADAQEVRLASAADGVFLGNDGPTVIHAGQMRRIPVMFSLGGGQDPVITVTWVEDGEPREREFHIG